MLTLSELNLVRDFLIVPQNHPAVNHLLLTYNYEGISNWFNDFGESRLNILFNYLDYNGSNYTDKTAFANILPFQPWYSKMLDTLTVSNVPNMPLNQVKYHENVLISICLEHNLVSMQMQEVINELFKRQYYNELYSLLVCLTQSQIFSARTYNIYAIELMRVNGFPIPRWQALGLPENPTTTEVESALML